MVGAESQRCYSTVSCGFCYFYFKACTEELGGYPKDIKSRENTAGKFFYVIRKGVFADPKNA